MSYSFSSTPTGPLALSHEAMRNTWRTPLSPVPIGLCGRGGAGFLEDLLAAIWR